MNLEATKQPSKSFPYSELEPSLRAVQENFRVYSIDSKGVGPTHDLTRLSVSLIFALTGA
jgi:hypothetical protein